MREERARDRLRPAVREAVGGHHHPGAHVDGLPGGGLLLALRPHGPSHPALRALPPPPPEALPLVLPPPEGGGEAEGELVRGLHLAVMQPEPLLGGGEPRRMPRGRQLGRLVRPPRAPLVGHQRHGERLGLGDGLRDPLGVGLRVSGLPLRPRPRGVPLRGQRGPGPRRVPGPEGVGDVLLPARAPAPALREEVRGGGRLAAGGDAEELGQRGAPLEVRLPAPAHVHEREQVPPGVRLQPGEEAPEERLERAVGEPLVLGVLLLP
mmetsp:Transcript_13940/g.44223  ORF Transcript_13940/g.44223 Transcript_13940/m.44223 type:complete len:265 (-) Transcript_13940:450-1244(-)